MFPEWVVFNSKTPQEAVPELRFPDEAFQEEIACSGDSTQELCAKTTPSDGFNNEVNTLSQSDSVVVEHDTESPPVAAEGDTDDGPEIALERHGNGTEAGSERVEYDEAGGGVAAVVEPLERLRALAYATKLVSMGFPVVWLRSPLASEVMDRDVVRRIPEERRGKAPVFPGWNQGPALRMDQLYAQYGESEKGYNVGIRTGYVAESEVCVIGVDLDSAETVAWAQEFLPITNLMVNTRKGQHWYYRCVAPGIPNKVHAIINGQKVALDIRADGGVLVAPGSVHGTGWVYRAVKNWTKERVSLLPIFSPAWFDTSNKSPMAERQALQVEQLAVIKREQEKFKQNTEAQTKKTPIAARINRAIAYLKAVPSTVSGQGTASNECLATARALVRGLLLSPQQAATIMANSKWNNGCTTPEGSPYPWAFDELLHKCKDAESLPFDKPLGYLLAADQGNVSEPPAQAPTPPGPLEALPKPRTPSDLPSSPKVSLVEGVMEEDFIPDPCAFEWAFTDSGNAERLATRFHSSLRWLADAGEWLVWNAGSSTWEPGEKMAGHATKIVARRLPEEMQEAQMQLALATEAAKDGAKHTQDALKMAKGHIAELVRFVKYSESYSGRSNMLKLAAMEPGITTTTSHFDKDPYALGVRNGLVQLNSGDSLDTIEFRPVNRADYVRKRCNVGFDPLATCPQWLKSLDDWMLGRQELVDFLQRLAGMSITGDITEPALFIF